MSRRAAAMFAGLCVVWGIPYFMIKIAVTEISPFVLVLARTSLAALVLLPLALSRGALPSVLPRWRPLLVFSAVEIAIPWFLLSDAERHLTSSLTGLLVAAVPLVGVGLALLRPDGDRLGPLGLAGLLLGLLGVAALVGLDVQGAQMGAVFEMGGVAVGYALGPVILARWFADTPGLGVTTASLTICALVYMPLAALTWPDHMPSGKVLASIVGLAVVCTSVAFLMLFELVGEIGPVRATVFTYVNPAVAVAAGVILLGEPLTPATVIGFVLVVAGSILATRRRRSPETSPPTALPHAVGSSGSTRAAGRPAASARPEPECG
jgi:drug/metabolite transporter (DMT)-like permease